MNIAFNRVSVIPVQKLNSPDRRKMSKMSYDTDFPFNNRTSKEKVSFASGSKLNYFA